jgi:hypothetical protein
MGYITGQAIKSKKVIGINLEIIVVDELLQECICIELNSHDAKRINVKFEDVEVKQLWMI